MLFAAVLTGCTGTPSTTEPTTDQNQEKTATEILAPCHDELPRCESSKSPTVCVASGYNHNVFIKERNLIAAGSNPCEARKNLIKIVCASGKNPTLLENINCLPSPLEDECFQKNKPSSCEKSDKKIFCIAREYAGRELTLDLAVSGRGLGECSAMKNLKDMACRLLLKPSELDHVSCEEDHSNNECPLAVEMCEKEYLPVACTGSLNGETLHVFDVNECIGRAQLSSLVCQKNLPPSKLENVTCVAGE